MSLIGAGCVLVVAGGTQTRVGVFRAASQPIQRSSDFSKTQVSTDSFNSTTLKHPQSSLYCGACLYSIHKVGIYI